VAIGKGPAIGHDEDPGADSPIFSEINITPLTDIFLVLLIIFMVTSSVMSQLGVDVDLPRASHSMTEAQPEGVILTLLPAGGLKVNQRPVEAGDWDRLELELREAFKVSKEPLVILEGDRSAFLGSVIEVMDHARKAGALKFAIAALPGDTGD
jgi:biopolymer transport protein ExbD